MWYVLLAYVCWCVLLYFYQSRMIFLTGLTPPPLRGPPSDDVAVTRIAVGKAGYVESWFFPAPSAHAQDRAPVVIFFHGNAELIDYQDSVIDGYRRLGCSVLLPEYRGYGRSAGTPSQKALLADSLRFYEALIEREDVDRRRILYHGRSLGAGPAFDLARHHKPAAVVVESAFSSIVSMGRKYLVPAFLARHPFRNDRVIAQLDAPVLIFHGSADRIIPATHGRRLHDLARDAEYIEFDAGHNNFPGEGNREAYWNAIESFLTRNGVIGKGDGSGEEKTKRHSPG